MRTGRPPTPTSLKVLRGETRPSHLRADVLMAPPGKPVPPRGFTARERRAFADIVDKLEVLNLASATDSGVIGILARATVRADLAAAILRKEGLVTTGARGGPIRHPAQMTIDKAEQTCLRAAAQLGLEPTSRERLRTPVSDVPVTYRRMHDGV
jgi:P27 family predicted phage terminase small subunit